MEALEEVVVMKFATRFPYHRKARPRRSVIPAIVSDPHSAAFSATLEEAATINTYSATITRTARTFSVRKSGRTVAKESAAFFIGLCNRTCHWNTRRLKTQNIKR